jgi:hypothetical protein
MATGFSNLFKKLKKLEGKPLPITKSKHKCDEFFPNFKLQFGKFFFFKNREYAMEDSYLFLFIVFL